MLVIKDEDHEVEEIHAVDPCAITIELPIHRGTRHAERTHLAASGPAAPQRTRVVVHEVLGALDQGDAMDVPERASPPPPKARPNSTDALSAHIGPCARPREVHANQAGCPPTGTQVGSVNEAVVGSLDWSDGGPPGDS